MSIMNPELNYAAPEFVQGVKCDTFADIFSLGLLAYSIFNNNHLLIESSDLLDNYKKSIEKVILVFLNFYFLCSGTIYKRFLVEDIWFFFNF